MENYQDLFSLPIEPRKGNKYVYINMPLLDLKDIVWHFMPHDNRKSGGAYFIYTQRIMDCIDVSISVITGKLYAISFIGNYKGTYKGIGVGSTVRDLLKVRPDTAFDEQYLLVGEHPWDLIIRIDNNDEQIDTLDDVMDNKIIEITVEDQTLI